MTEHFKDTAVLTFSDKLAFQNWLHENFTDTGGYFLKFAKKSSQKTTLSYEDAREVAIAYGWIDGVRNRLDDNYYLIRFTHRRPKSIWSKINVSIAEMLISSDQMHTEGAKEVEAAKNDGRWDQAY